MSTIREGSYARHAEHGTVKVLIINGDMAEVAPDADETRVVPLASLVLDPIDAAEQEADEYGEKTAVAIGITAGTTRNHGAGALGTEG
jgi:hypothetical protein